MDYNTKYDVSLKLKAQMDCTPRFMRSPVGEWKHSALRSRYRKEFFPRRRKVTRTFGRLLSKIDRGDETALFSFARFVNCMDIAVSVDPEMGTLNALADAFDYDPLNVVEMFQPDYVETIRRDHNKFKYGMWARVLWHDHADWWRTSPYYYTHSLHMSTTSKGNVAFAESAEKRAKERYTIMKPGRYLARFFPELPESEVKMWAERCAATTAKLELHFTGSDDPDEWVEVYGNGPDSCMSGENCVKVYAHDKSVLRLAYTTRDKDIVGRCIVREDTKQYIRVYPNNNSTEESRIQTATTELIENAGYRPGNLYGVKLAAIRLSRHDEKYVMPYLDHGTGDSPCVELDSDGKYFTVGRHGAEACNTCGTITLKASVECDNCGDTCDEDDTTYVNEDEVTVCLNCIDNDYTNAIGRRGRHVLTHETNTIYNESDGEYYALHYTNENNVYMCEYSDKWYSIDDLVSTPSGLVHTDFAVALDVETPDGHSYAMERDTVTTHDGRVIHKHEAVEVGGKTYHVDDEVTEAEAETEEK